MRKIISITLIASTMIGFVACSDNHAATNSAEKKAFDRVATAKKKREMKAVKNDGPALGAIETEAYIFKLHQVFAYEPKGSAVLAGMKPKQGSRLIYLDVSLKNKSERNLEGGFVFIALKITDDKGKEYKKPAAALAAYASEKDDEYNDAEYAALWESFQPNEFHREVVYAVEVPVNQKNFLLHLPADNNRKEWKTVAFSL